MADIEKEKKQLEDLLDEFCKLSTPDEEAAFSMKMKKVVASKSEEEKELFSQAFLGGGKKAIEESEKTISDVNLRLVLDRIYPAVSWSYIASRYFGKSRSWLNQRINGYQVNGEPATFTENEKKKLITALTDLGQILQKSARQIEHTL
ncbi:DUF5053 domain-containing protein [Bacteroides sp. 224]|uniref:DUF5053 domain-containing protein n=1 Tax=Bacteroides sp. 224 TaxID=2302936 RepID=UPI0013D48E1F|nr:DUF5053 domain-containing protein [Bacteroides sp. 224]NDV64875.1 DUF5053 domain-containing protein [Bacteroides sp. 224]